MKTKLRNISLSLLVSQWRTISAFELQIINSTFLSSSWRFFGSDPFSTVIWALRVNWTQITAAELQRDYFQKENCLMFAQSCKVVSLTIASQNTTEWEIKQGERLRTMPLCVLSTSRNSTAGPRLWHCFHTPLPSASPSWAFITKGCSKGSSCHVPGSCGFLPLSGILQAIMGNGNFLLESLQWRSIASPAPFKPWKLQYCYFSKEGVSEHWKLALWD